MNIPQQAQLRIAVQYGDPGAWMYHCHILEHQERGMMGELKVLSRDSQEEVSAGSGVTLTPSSESHSSLVAEP